MSHLLRRPAEGWMPPTNSEATTRMPVNCSTSGMPSKATKRRQTRPVHANTATRIAVTARCERYATSVPARSRYTKSARLKASSSLDRGSPTIRAHTDSGGTPGHRVRIEDTSPVDKLQERDAAVVVYSMATSSAEDVPGTLDFLCSRNLFNVAVSRARTIEQMRLINALCRFAEMAG